MKIRRPLIGIDLGSSKLCCWVLEKEGQERFLGAGHIASRGIWSGQIQDLKDFEEALMQLLYETEKHIHFPIRNAYVALGGSALEAILCKGEIRLPQERVKQADIFRLVTSFNEPAFHTVHCIPLTFYLDDQANIHNPLGLSGSVLRGEFYLLRMGKRRYETFLQCFKRSQIYDVDFVFSGYASALSCLSTDEQNLGATVIDIGSSSAVFATFFQGHMIHTGMVPIGGFHVTQDIARGCNTPMSHAERLKNLYGAALMNFNNYHVAIPLLALGSRDIQEIAPINRSLFVTIIKARYEEIFCGLKKTMALLEPKMAFDRLVLTGGASQMPGLKELMEKIFSGRCVRIATPVSLSSHLPTLASFSSLTGLFLHKRKDFEIYSLQKKKTFNFFSWIRNKI